MTVNKAILVGNLGADPETRTTQSGTTVCNLRIATSERVKKGDSWEDHTEWHRVVCFGKTAENCQRFLSKGRQVYIEGRIRTNKWQDNDGNDRYTTEVVAREVRFLSGGNGDSGGGNRGGGRGGGGRSSGRGNGGGDGGGGYSGGGGAPPDDDIPF